MKMSLLIKFLLIYIFSFATFANNQYLSGDAPVEEREEEVEGTSPFLSSGDHKSGEKEDEIQEESPFLTVEDNPPTELTTKEELGSMDIKPLGSFENRENYLETDDREFAKKFVNEGSRNFEFYFIQDNYTVTDSRNLHQKIFEESTGSMRAGTLHLSGGGYFSHGKVLNFSYLGTLGIGYSKGKGYFEDDNLESDAIFSLWSIPVDLGVGTELLLGKWMVITLRGGPSVMGLMQTRSDLESGARNKRRRQVSYGYFGEGKIRFNLSTIFSGIGVKIYRMSKITNMSFDLIARTQNYENFNDVIKITGNSFGAGFSFTFL